MTTVMISPSQREVSPAEQLCWSPRLVPPSGGRVSSRKVLFYFFSHRKTSYGRRWASESHQGAHEVGGAPRGGAPHPHGQGVAPLVFIFCEDFFIVFSKVFRGVSGHSDNFYFLHIKQHHGNSAENNVCPGQFHSNHTSQSPKQGQKCFEKQIRWRRINSPKLKPLLVLKQFS